MRTLLAEAVSERRVLRVYYHPGWRVIEPHTFGRSGDGDMLLRAFQRDGASESGEHVDWKLFRVDRMRDLEQANENFDGPRPGYKRGDRAMKGGIIAQL